MALLTGTYKSAAEAQIAVDDLEKAGVPRTSVHMEPADDSGVWLCVTTDAERAEEAFRIMKTHGSVAEETGEVREGPPFPTENRDTSREPLENRDDVGSITRALDREHPRVAAGPK
ncbi:MAG: hypothetical protein ABJF23_26450 [Bryobacteraceae bacterium]